MSTKILTLGDMKPGARYIDNGGETFIVTDAVCPVDGYTYSVEITGDYAGKQRLTRNDLKLVQDSTKYNGLPFVCSKLNGWSK